MAENNQKTPDVRMSESVASQISAVLAGIRVPDLPYPAGKPAADAVSDWRPLLLSCWMEQRDERVTHVIRSVHLTWSVRQVNAAYLADRIMDVFLKSSGLHPELARKIARLRFYLAWRMNLDGAEAFTDTLMEWLDNLRELRGWSNSGGRSGKVILDQLQALVDAVTESFQQQSPQSLESFCGKWADEAAKRQSRVGMLNERLLKTEQGAARQRYADQVARATIGRALEGRKLPEAVSGFILECWYPLLKQAALDGGVSGELFRHGSKLLEWLVWAGDPRLSADNQSRLYQVGEQMPERIAELWGRVFDQPLPAQSMAGVEAVLVARIRGEEPELTDALKEPARFEYELSWLAVDPVDAATLEARSGHWYVEGEGSKEQRRFFFTLLADSSEVLWTNGEGLKLALEPWKEFELAVADERLRPLPTLTPFGLVLTDTVQLLAKVCEKQRRQREQAAEQARLKAEALKLKRAEAEQARKQEEAERQAELKRQREKAEQQRLADEQAEKEFRKQKARLQVQEQVQELHLGSWIVLEPEHEGGEPTRLKLAVRLNATRKLVFVDRLGLNRQELRESDLVDSVLAGQARILGSSAELNDTLSRAAGRMRVGR